MKLQRLLEKRRKTTAEWLLEEQLMSEPMQKIRDRLQEMGLDPLSADEETVVMLEQATVNATNTVPQQSETAAPTTVGAVMADPQPLQTTEVPEPEKTSTSSKKKKVMVAKAS